MYTSLLCLLTWWKITKQEFQQLHVDVSNYNVLRVPDRAATGTLLSYGRNTDLIIKCDYASGITMYHESAYSPRRSGQPEPVKTAFHPYRSLARACQSSVLSCKNNRCLALEICCYDSFDQSQFVRVYILKIQGKIEEDRNMYGYAEYKKIL